MSNLTPPRPRGTAATVALVALVVAIAMGGLWWAQHRDPASGGDGASPTPSERTLGHTAGATKKHPKKGDNNQPGGDRGLGDRAEDLAAAAPSDPRVVVISVDGLGSRWVTPSTTPTIADLLATGAGTLNARTEVEKTVTLPNHTGMVTGIRVDAAQGGHGVTWNHTSTRSVAPGTSSVFSMIGAAGGTSSVFAGKDKFEMWGRAWPGMIQPLTINEDQPALVSSAIEELRTTDDDLLFLHLAGPDSAGHAQGWGSPSYLRAVARADADIHRVVSAILDDDELADDVFVIVTADHGGLPGQRVHLDRTRSEDFTIPFVVWGPGIAQGDLYALNPDYRDPGTQQLGYDGPQPVRNGDVANLVTDLLGIDAVEGSEFDAAHDLDVEK
ncbi:sulfatase-like hydrolase/transferase [Nocardioides humilatus]|uniref:Sulfatase-like hydrolase/transferase n=1 Tax=Nocardioides humilatus TaxID=2607660 RepID=A0A5B1LLD2_9ACTN|nr:alkaline phosphatase family protein [Nocardioides humilatus]KAA1421541.1 sulfatase-like hydrolase/transferase [Nocardioides humilatus]